MVNKPFLDLLYYPFYSITVKEQIVQLLCFQKGWTNICESFYHGDSVEKVELKRIELLTPCLQSRCSPKLSYSPIHFCVGHQYRLIRSPTVKNWWAQVELNH